MSAFYENKNSRYNMEVTVGNLRVTVYDRRYLNEYSVTYGMHSHYFYELFFVLTGEARVISEEKTRVVRADDLYVIPPGCQHMREFYEEGNPCEQEPVRFTYEKLPKGEDVYSLIDKLIGSQRDVLVEEHCTTVRPLFEMLCSETDNHAPLEKRKVQALITILILEVIRHCYPNLEWKNDRPNDGVPSRNFIIEDFFSRRYPENVVLVDLAVALNLSAKQTSRILMELYGVTFRKKLTETRMQIAKSLLRYTETPLDEIAAGVGYQSLNGFYEAFRAEVGMSPSHYRKERDGMANTITTIE